MVSCAHFSFKLVDRKRSAVESPGRAKSSATGLVLVLVVFIPLCMQGLPCLTAQGHWAQVTVGTMLREVQANGPWMLYFLVFGAGMMQPVSKQGGTAGL